MELLFFLKNKFIYLFIYFWLRWVFVAVHRLSLVAASRGYSSLRCAGFSLWWILLVWSTGSRHVGFSRCGTWAQQLWHTGLVAPQHVGSSRTRARTCVPCIGRRIPNHCATRGAPGWSFNSRYSHESMLSFLIFSPATGAVQAEPRSNCGWSEEALHIFTSKCQGGAGPLPLQWAWGAQAHCERRDLGLQQGGRAIKGSCELNSFLFLQENL